MGCFVVPAAEAVITTVAQRIIKSKERKAPEVGDSEISVKIPFSAKLGWLNKLLWGGSALLAFEHLWHGEVSASFPFLTAMADPSSMAEMLHEMATTGVIMTVAVTAVWLVMLAGAHVIEKRAARSAENEETAEAAE